MITTCGEVDSGFVGPEMIQPKAEF